MSVAGRKPNWSCGFGCTNDLHEIVRGLRREERLAGRRAVHESRNAREQLHVLAACRHRGKHEKRDAYGQAVEPDVIRNPAHESGREAYLRNQVGPSVRYGQSPAQRRAYLGLAIFHGIDDAADRILIGIADGQSNEFAQEVGFGVAAERNTYAFR